MHLKKWYKLIRKDQTRLHIQDLGSGSKKLGEIRDPRQLLSNSSSKGLYGRVLYKIAKHYKPAVMLELGTSIGVGSVHLKKGNPDGHLVTVEGCPDTLRFAEKQFDYWNLEQVTTIENSFETFLSSKSSIKYDLVYLDGHHSGPATVKYLEELEACTHEDTLFILDDIRWNNDMWQYWNSLVNSEQFHVSVDLGRMGLLWKKTGQRKEHFFIRPAILKTKLI